MAVVAIMRETDVRVQLRIHSSTKSTFYVHTSSHPVIEHCSELSFARYPFSPAGESPSDQVSASRQFWRPPTLAHLHARMLPHPSSQPSELSVLDFSHIRTSSHSPNWRLLPPDEVARREDWSLISRLQSEEDETVRRTMVVQLLQRLLPSDLDVTSTL